VDNASVYTTTRTAVLDLVGGLGPDELARPVAALPGWTVRDTVAHLAGVCADTLDGRTEGGGSPAWTARQLAERADRSVGAVCDEWAGRGADLDGWLAGPGAERGGFVVFDAWTHEHDLRAATGRARSDDSRAAWLAGRALPVFDRRFRDAGVAALRVSTDGVDTVLGDGEPEVTWTADSYEVMRTLFGRRTLTQMRAGRWDGDPTPWLGHLHLFDPPAAALID